MLQHYPQHSYPRQTFKQATWHIPSLTSRKSILQLWSLPLKDLPCGAKKLHQNIWCLFYVIFWCQVALWQLFQLNEYEWMNELTSLHIKFIGVSICQQLFHCNTFWQSYCNNKVVQCFLVPQCIRKECSHGHQQSGIHT